MEINRYLRADRLNVSIKQRYSVKVLAQLAILSIYAETVGRHIAHNNKKTFILSCLQKLLPTALK